MQTTALLVIDVQRGAFDGQRVPPIDAPDRLLRNVCQLIDAAREGGRPIVFIQHCDEPGQAFEEGTPHWALHESLVPASGDGLVKKHASSSFEDTPLQSQLAERKVEALVLCGLQSEFCVSNTARASLKLGYADHVAEEGHGTWPSEGRTADDIRREANTQLAQAGAVIASTESLARVLSIRQGAQR